MPTPDSGGAVIHLGERVVRNWLGCREPSLKGESVLDNTTYYPHALLVPLIECGERDRGAPVRYSAVRNRRRLALAEERRFLADVCAYGWEDNFVEDVRILRLVAR